MQWMGLKSDGPRPYVFPRAQIDDVQSSRIPSPLRRAVDDTWARTPASSCFHAHRRAAGSQAEPGDRDSATARTGTAPGGKAATAETAAAATELRGSPQGQVSSAGRRETTVRRRSG